MPSVSSEVGGNSSGSSRCPTDTYVEQRGSGAPSDPVPAASGAVAQWWVVVRRIGEILLEHGWIEPKLLERALARQRATGQRLCSLLVASGVLSVDEASRALGEQHGVLAVLAKHLTHRDRELARHLPAALARSLCAVPIGRKGTGEVIVCVRDPQPELAAALARVMHERVLLAVAPAELLATVVAEVYPDEPATAIEDASTADAIEEVDLDMIEEREPAAEHDELAGFAALRLVELDDRGVSKDPAQSGVIQIGPLLRTELPPGTENKPGDRTLTPAIPRTTTSARPPRPSLLPSTSARSVPSALPPSTGPRPQASALAPLGVAAAPPPDAAASITLARTTTPAVLAPQAAVAVGTEPPTRRFVELHISLAETLAAIEASATVDAALEATMAFAAGRWAASLLLSVEQGTASGELGHGKQLAPEVVRALVIPLSATSLVRAAHDATRVVTEVPAGTGAVEDRLERLLGVPRFPAASAIRSATGPAYILVIGDPVTGDAGAAASDLGRLAHALGAALMRIVTRS